MWGKALQRYKKIGLVKDLTNIILKGCEQASGDVCYLYILAKRVSYIFRIGFNPNATLFAVLAGLPACFMVGKCREARRVW